MSDVKKCKIHRFTVVLNKEAYTINEEGKLEMTGKAQKEYDDFVSKIRQDMMRAAIEIIDEGYGENDDELEWHITGGFKKMTENGGFAAIVAFEVCVRAEE